MNDHLLINEIFHSIQGEGTRAGMPCVFVRLTGCHLRCRYCDTAHAFHEGRRRPVAEVVASVVAHACDLVQVTGGEPLLQADVYPLMALLCDRGLTVLLETSGACDIAACDRRVVRIMDLKTPGSGEADRNLWSNLEHLTARDEVKFVICDRADYEWARERIGALDLVGRVAAVLLATASPIPPDDLIPGAAGPPLADLARWILDDRLPVRLQVQLHKLIWDPATRGV